MSSAVKTADRHVDGILDYMRDYLAAREQQVIRMNSRVENVIDDIIWIHLEILKHVLQKPKVFGGEKFRVADVLSGFDDQKRKALLSASDQNSILDELIDRNDETNNKKGADAIHDMRSYFRTIDPALESLTQLIQYWVKWDLPDASDLHSFDEQVRRLTALRGIQISDDIRNRYRQALGKPPEVSVSDDEIFQIEFKRLEQIAGRFCSRRSEHEPYQLIIRRNEIAEGETKSYGDPYDYKLHQCESIAQRLEEERRKFTIDTPPEAVATSPQSEAIEIQM